MKMKRILALLFVCASLAAKADEGMWLVNDIDARLWQQMRKAGVKVSREAIYAEGSESLSGAVGAVDGGMGTGSFISPDGLFITNHHVAYGNLCALSGNGRNCLEDGFWAATRQDEIPLAGTTVWFLRRVKDITDEALALKEQMQASGRWGMMASRRMVAELEKRYAGEGYTPSCVAMWGGRRYYMYFYEVYRDVRLAGAPPVRIGAFGGETDNWGWTQHKGDFALYRIYAAPDGKPADYSADNVPVHPSRWLTVSTAGIDEGDYTMVIGFPGHTNRYLSSYAVEEKYAVRNPVVVEARHSRMDIIRASMEADSTVRMAYADRFFSLANYADYARWENICLRRYDVVGRYRARERDIMAWIAADTALTRRYGDLTRSLARGYAARRDAMSDCVFMQETWFGSGEAMLTANRVASAAARLKRDGITTVAASDKASAAIFSAADRMRENYDRATDRELFAAMTALFVRNIDLSKTGEYPAAALAEYGGDASAMAYGIYDGSFCTSAADFDAFFSCERSLDEILRDPLVAFAAAINVPSFKREVHRAERQAGVDVRQSEAAFARALYEYRDSRGEAQYPDANSTLRLSYGHVRALSPSDGVHYDWRSTARGYIEKRDSSQHDFRVDRRMTDLVERGEWGRWGDRRHGGLTVDFITDNDITGGNSGSPVLNARGELVGLAFDGNRESMSGDVWFQPDYARTVCVDIRFVMWVIEKYAGAGALLDEISFTK